MSKSKGNTPNVEMRRRNNKPHTSTPADEVSQILSGRLEKDGGPIQIVDSEPDERPAADFEATSDKREMSSQPPAMSLEKLTACSGFDAEYDQVERAVRNASNLLQTGQVIDLKMFVATLRAQLDPFEGDLLLDEDSKNPELYHPANLEFIVTRFPKGANEETKALVSRFMFSYAQAIGGFRNGWRLDMSGPLMAIEWEPSRAQLYFTERDGKALGAFYQDWAHRLAQQGLNDGTTIDFMVIEKNNDSTQVIDAWNCRSMYPKEASGFDSGFTRSERGVETCSFVVELGGNVMRGKQVLEEAAHLWKQQAQGQAA
jgi:hypothetical protein